ncbi:MAG: NAD(P)H-binding protein [Elusimicrobiota bacterium]|nr:NAD(P)H-binding protein [Elusimicrobiota bacterium]
MNAPLDVVTGAFSYSGGYVAERLLAAGRRVATLTGHPGRPSPLQGRVAAHPLDFARPDRLAESLRGVDTLYNNYWVRFAHGGMTHERAVRNSEILFQAAAKAGVRRIVHVSIANADPGSDLPYYRGKGLVEQALKAAGPSYAILGPTVLFGGYDVLINNIAWMLRRFPAFAIIGDGRYPIQPIAVEDLADLAVAAGAGEGNTSADAVGPEVFAYEDLVRLLAERIGRRPWFFKVGPRAGLALAAGLGLLTGDVVLTQEEVDGLTRGLLKSKRPATGRRAFKAWLAAEGGDLGRDYHNELKRHFEGGETEWEPS